VLARERRRTPPGGKTRRVWNTCRHADAVTGPMPGMLISRRAVSSFCAICAMVRSQRAIASSRFRNRTMSGASALHLAGGIVSSSASMRSARVEMAGVEIASLSSLSYELRKMIAEHLISPDDPHTTANALSAFRSANKSFIALIYDKPIDASTNVDDPKIGRFSTKPGRFSQGLNEVGTIARRLQRCPSNRGGPTLQTET
jgi:hypothetical protein